ncbi:hypothetical protein [Rhizobium leguminosarum]|uniref:hypothetical protein n=1 Tax=Rhizobium leguminosarum TaxID=384 RepID=UPI003F9931EF
MPDLPALTSPAEDPTPGERWVSFLRGYGPVGRRDGMYAETIRDLADSYRIEPLRFPHPFEEQIYHALRPAEGVLTNLILTGTAGDGKTTLCNELWERLGGDDSRRRGRNRKSYASLPVETPSGERLVHFIFEFSGFAPDQGQEWPEEKHDLVKRFAASIIDPDPTEFFVVAANDGKLVNEWDGLPAGSSARRLNSIIEELLSSGHSGRADLHLLFLNLSRMSTKSTLKAAIKCLLGRSEWSCFETEGDDPAFGPASPLWKNHKLLSDPAIQRRLESLAELCDANGFHVSIREILLLLVNGMLGHEPSGDNVMRPMDLRTVAEEGRFYEASLYQNVFGANLKEQRREQFAVFNYLNGFRIGFETSNIHDALVVFGPDDQDLSADHGRILAADDQFGYNPYFEARRTAYLNADEDRTDTSPFLDALVSERRRLFFRLSDDDPRFDPWKLTVFEAAGIFQKEVLWPLAVEKPVEMRALSLLVQGLNRVWTGMLIGEAETLYLSAGLDFSSARVSDLYLNEVPIQGGLYGNEITVRYDPDLELPVLRVAIDENHYVDFTLLLRRFEFLIRVAKGALPSSFSKECYEDVIAFKTKVLSQYFQLTKRRATQINIMSIGDDGVVNKRRLGVAL